MTKGRAIHVVPSPGGGWSVRKSGSERASKKFVSKEEAVDWGRAHSRQQGTEFIIHRTDGTVQERSSYRNDPFPPHDRNTHIQSVGANGGERG